MSTPLLSQLILDGCKLAPVKIERMFVRKDEAGVLCACALGAAALGTGADIDFWTVSGVLSKSNIQIHDDVPDALFKAACEHTTLFPPCSLFEVVTRLNDDTDLSREQIAALLAEHGL